MVIPQLDPPQLDDVYGAPEDQAIIDFEKQQINEGDRKAGVEL